MVHLRQAQTNEYVEIGRTEHINDNLNPKWEMKFVLDYKFEERQVSTKIWTTTTVFVIMNNMQCPMLFGNHGIMYLYCDLGT